MNYVIITSYGEVNATEKAINAILPQLPQDSKLIVSDPFPETKWMLEEKFPQVEYFEDPDQGKSKALNLLLKQIYSENKDSVIISTDGDVYVSDNAIKEILEIFKDKEIGILCGKPVSLNSRNNLFGYWSHLSFDEMHRTRKKLFSKRDLFETSGYLMAFRNGIIKEFPIEASEDSILPFLFWEKGYKVGYADKAEVYVMNPRNFKDWITQKKRNVKGHLALHNLIDFSKLPKRKNSFLKEAIRGLTISLTYPKNLREIYWNILIFPARAYLHLSGFYETKIKKQKYKDGWRENETPSTRTLD